MWSCKRAADKAAAGLQLRQSGVPLSMRPWKSIGATAVWSAASVAAPARRSRRDGAIVCARSSSVDNGCD